MKLLLPIRVLGVFLCVVFTTATYSVFLRNEKRLNPCIMKTKLLTLLCCALGVFYAEAQENKTIKEETTVKRVVKKEGSKVIVQEVEAVETEKGAVIVAGTEEENQYFKEDATKSGGENVLVDTVQIDKANEARIAAEKKKREEELQRSIEEAKAAAETQRKLLEQKEQERLRALEENRKRLEKRGKGVGKLKKKKNN